MLVTLPVVASRGQQSSSFHCLSMCCMSRRKLHWEFWDQDVSSCFLCLSVSYQGPIYAHGEGPAPIPPQSMLVQPEMHIPHPGQWALFIYFKVFTLRLEVLMSLPPPQASTPTNQEAPSPTPPSMEARLSLCHQGNLNSCCLLLSTLHPVS